MTSLDHSRLSALMEEWRAIVNDTRYHDMFRSGIARCADDLSRLLKEKQPEDTTP
jgi:hypothetical protein